MKQRTESAKQQTGEQAPRRSGFFSGLFCTHDWVKRSQLYQPDRAKGVIVWKCNHCGKTTQLKNWQTPG